MFETFNLQTEIRLFEIFKMFYPPKGLCESRTQWGPFDSLSILLCLRNGFDTFKISFFRRPFGNLENVIFTDGWDGIDGGWVGVDEGGGT